jgi:hypothetical protein
MAADDSSVASIFQGGHRVRSCAAPKMAGRRTGLKGRKANRVFSAVLPDSGLKLLRAAPISSFPYLQ